MKKRFIAFALVAVMLLGGCSENSQDTPVKDKKETSGIDENKEGASYHFGFSAINMSNPYYVALSNGIKDALQEKGSSLEVKDAKLSADLQNQQIDEMIENGIDCLFLAPADWEKISPSLDKLKEKKIPVVNVDTEVKDIDKVTAYVGSDNKKAGEIIGERLIQRHKDGGKVLLLESTNVNSVNDRITGFEQSIIGKGFEVVAREEVTGDINSALERTKKALSENADMTAIVCGNDTMALGALVATQSLGLSGIEIYGIDGSPDIKKELLKKNSPVVGTCAQTPAKIGRDSANIGLAIMTGDRYEEKTYEDVFFIDAENVDMYGSDGWQ